MTIDELVDAVAAIIEAHGVESVTMRRLAQQCGVGAASIYGYVRTKDELLGLFADRLLGDITVPNADATRPQDEIISIFRATYQVLAGHPELVQIVSAQPVPGSAAQHLFDRVLRALVTLGLDDQQIHTAYQLLASYTTGFIQHETARRHRAPGLPELIANARRAQASLADLTTSGGTQDHHQRDFDAGLAIILRGLTATEPHGDRP